MVDKPRHELEKKRIPTLGHRTKEQVFMEFGKIFISRSIKEILHLLPKDERKNAKQETLEELLRDCIRYAVE
jgi:hypothetical protein